LSKFRIILKLTGLELEVEGSREDVPLLARNLGAQLGNLLAPAAAMADGKALPSNERATITQAPTSEPAARSHKRGIRRTGATATASGEASAAIDFKHDPAAFGSPLQTWNTAKKAMWLLYVSDKQGGPKEMPPAQIAKTFNKHFKQAGTITPNNVSRDLGKIKSTPPAKAADDATKDPATWYLTDSGTKEAERLVTEARGDTAA
jgi:hypothetical protein